MTNANSINMSVTPNGAFSTYTEMNAFSPTISGSTAAGVGTYTTQAGFYNRIGNMVFVSINMVWTAHTGTGNMLITSLPFTVRATANYVPAGLMNEIQFALGAGVTYAIAEFAQGTTQAALQGIRNNNTNLPIAMDAAGAFRMNGWYIT